MTAASDTAARIAAHLRMEPIPHEGPLFAPNYRSDEFLGPLPARYAGPPSRPAASSIYALLTAERFSALHRLATDELWHFYAGAPLELLQLDPDGHGRVMILGPDLLAGQHPQIVVRRGVWQGARLLAPAPGAYALVGNTLSPAFDPADYEPGDRAQLLSAYPTFAAWIVALTRGA